MPKATTPKSSQQRRHNPLEHDLVATGLLKNRDGRPSKRGAKEEAGDQGYVDAKASRKILSMSRDLLQEEEGSHGGSAGASAGPSAFDFDPSRFDAGSDQEQDDEHVNEEAWGDEDEDVEEIEVDAADLETFNRFVTSSMDEDPLLTHGWDGKPSDTRNDEGQGINLADLIMAKIEEKEAKEAVADRNIRPADEEYEITPKMAETFTKVGLFLHRYKSGPLPKPFKILPQIPGWEQLLEISRPDLWTPNACYAATRIFVSAKPIVVERFLQMVILDRVREDIYENKKLNPHLFNCLKKALFKSSAFFRGFLFPLVESGTCTLREAQIISGALIRVSIPVTYSAAALKRLCDTAAEQASQHSECVSATNYFIKVLLDKRYALPWQTLDALVFHFLRYASAAGEGDTAPKALPVIYHQCLLVFAQRYRNDISEDQREALLDLLLNHGHEKIAPEIRRELLAGRGRGVPVQPAGPAFDGDDTMAMDF